MIRKFIFASLSLAAAFTTQPLWSQDCTPATLSERALCPNRFLLLKRTKPTAKPSFQRDLTASLIHNRHRHDGTCALAARSHVAATFAARSHVAATLATSFSVVPSPSAAAAVNRGGEVVVHPRRTTRRVGALRELKRDGESARWDGEWRIAGQSEVGDLGGLRGAGRGQWQLAGRCTARFVKLEAGRSLFGGLRWSERGFAAKRVAPWRHVC